MSDTQKQVLCHKDLGLGLTHTNLKQRVRFPTIAKRAIAAKIATETISEELRVLYVALTRAKEKLILTGFCKDFEKLDLENSDTVIIPSETLAALLNINFQYIFWNNFIESEESHAPIS